MHTRNRCAFVLLAAAVMAAWGAIPAFAAPNDAFAGAQILTPPEQVISDTTGATNEPGEPAPTCGPSGATVWYAVTPATESTIELSTFGSKFDTIVAAYTGTDLTDLVEIACNDDAVETGSLQSKLSVETSGGQSLWIQVGGYLGASGVLKLSATSALLDNDFFAHAEQITALPFSTTQDTTTATEEAGEPGSDCGSIQSTRWFTYTPSGDQVLRVDTIGSDYDTLLAVYEGTSLATLSELACNDDGGFTLESVVTVPVVTGTTYYIQAGGFFDSAGTLVLNAVELIPPANDDFANAIVLVNPDQHSVNTAGATIEVGEQDPCFVNVGSTVWYSYTATAAGPVLADTYNSTFDTVLGVYTGSTLEDLTLVGCADDTQGLTSDVGFQAVTGETYWIQVGGFFGETGDAVVRLRSGASVPGVASVGAGTDEIGICLLGLCTGIL